MGASVIAGCDAAPVFQFSEAVFYDVALFVEIFIVLMLHFAVLFRRDARLNAFLTQSLAEPVRIITTIRKQF